MATHRSIADLFLLLLDLPADTPVYVTPGFGSWLNDAASAWPPPPGARGLWLIDTADPEGRSALASLSGAAASACDALLVLARGADTSSWPRRMLRTIRRPHRRIPSGTVARLLAGVRSGFELTPLGYAHEWETPADLEVRNAERAPHAAFLLTRSPLFESGIHAHIARSLGTLYEVMSLQLRARGAAVLLVDTMRGPRVVRAVPAGPLQFVVEQNHDYLIGLRQKVSASRDLLQLIPEPLFAEREGSLLLLGETLLPGTLAWQVARGIRAPTIRAHALEFLHLLRQFSAGTPLQGREVVERQCDADLAEVSAAEFLAPAVRDLLRAELEHARHVLGAVHLTPHTSHGDFGFGNILVDPGTQEVTGVIDWDTARLSDVPAIDRVNLEIQLERTYDDPSFARAVETVWSTGRVREVLEGDGGGTRARALYGIAVCRYITRAMRYPAVYRQEAAGFERALQWLARSRQLQITSVSP